jgi:hypothetical protein
MSRKDWNDGGQKPLMKPLEIPKVAASGGAHPQPAVGESAPTGWLEKHVAEAYFALFPDYAWSGAPEAIWVIRRHALELRAERDKLIELIGQSLSECVEDAGSDDPKIHPPEMSLLCRWNKAIGETGKLPMES